MPKRLGIHVIGPRHGESVVLHLPDGGIGVIDSFAGRVKAHPVIDYLNAQFTGLKELRFFALTHPHADHCYRAAEILDAFPAQEIWIYDPFPLGQVQDYYYELQNKGSADAIEKAMGLPAGSVSMSLLEFEKRFLALKKAKTLKYRTLMNKRGAEICEKKVKIHFLTPGDDQRLAYKQQIAALLKKVSADGTTLADLEKLSEADHNLASGAVLIEYGKSRALLMADAEDKLWEEWLAGNPELAKWKPVHFVKSAHHGSPNGFHAKLYTELADPVLTLAVVTPFSKGRTPLPTEPGVKSLQGRVKSVYCTNRGAAIESTELTWKPVTPRPLPSVPPGWVKDMAKKSSLAKLLVPEAGGKPPGGREPALPHTWIKDAHAKHSLWHLIRPDLRRPVPGLTVTEDYTVSAYLDDSGNVAELKTGYEAGVLA